MPAEEGEERKRETKEKTRTPKLKEKKKKKKTPRKPIRPCIPLQAPAFILFFLVHMSVGMYRNVYLEKRASSSHMQDAFPCPIPKGGKKKKEVLPSHKVPFDKNAKSHGPRKAQ